MNRIELTMLFYGCDEREARQIIAIENGESDGDFIELTAEELDEFLADSKDPATAPDNTETRQPDCSGRQE